MMLSDERNLWACALELERQHGEAALGIARRRITDLQLHDNHHGVKVWRGIRERIRILHNTSQLCH